MPTAEKYQQTQIMTASPMSLVVMMYDDCIQTLERAERAFALPNPQRIEAINSAILHAEDVITELAVSLDMEKGGEIARNLHRLYDFMIYHLSQANTRKEVNRVTEVRRMLCELREAWQKVREQEPGYDESSHCAKPRSMIAVNG